MFSDDDWSAESVDEEPESAVEFIRVMPLYDEKGVEIPDNELPWNNVTEENSPDESSENWIFDDMDDVRSNRSASEHRKRIAQSVREEALRRLGLSARTTAEFQTLVHWYDREEQSRMRTERRYENLRGNTTLEYDALTDGDILPISLSQPTFRQICRGEFDDYLANCLFEMHDLTDKTHIRKIVKNRSWIIRKSCTSWASGCIPRRS